MMRRSVLVIGGGPAGLTAALRLSARGYAVTLLEQGSELGGRLIKS
ncbi:MAG: FAD-dependent oxidoreductase, partial [Burkholderiales bacterium]